YCSQGPAGNPSWDGNWRLPLPLALDPVNRILLSLNVWGDHRNGNVITSRLRGYARGGTRDRQAALAVVSTAGDLHGSCWNFRAALSPVCFCHHCSHLGLDSDRQRHPARLWSDWCRQGSSLLARAAFGRGLYNPRLGATQLFWRGAAHYDPPAHSLFHG